MHTYDPHRRAAGGEDFKSEKEGGGVRGGGRKDAEENVSVGLRNESLSLSGGKLLFFECLDKYVSTLIPSFTL